MEDKRTVLAIFLCIIVVIMYSELVIAPHTRPPQPVTAPPVSEEIVDRRAPRPSPVEGTVHSPRVPEVLPEAVSPEELTPPSLEELRNAPQTTIETGHAIVELNHLGARLSSYRLKNYKVSLEDLSLYDLVSRADGAPLPLAVYAGGLNDDNVMYELEETSLQPQQGSFSIDADETLTLSFIGTLPADGGTIQKTFTFSGNSNLFDLDVRLSSPVADGSRVWVEWSQFLPPEALDPARAPAFLRLREDNKVDTIPVSPDDIAEDDRVPHGSSQWVSFSSGYFMASLIPTATGNNVDIGRDNDVYFARVSGSGIQAQVRVYAGPKEFETLRDLGFQLERNVNLGIFSFLAHPLLWFIRLFYSFLHNYGLAIILLTLLIKAAFLPLTKASFRSMRKLQDLQPEMKALRERIKDPTQLNQEMMALYKRKKVNPMGGCLPILIQLPVFLGLYNALLNSIELRHAPFALWIHDLSSPERLEVLGIGIPVMVLLMGASMFLQQWTTPTAMDPTQKKVFMMMPVVFTIIFIIFPFPAGLVLYWLVNNVISIIQQIYLRSDKTASPAKATLVASVVIFVFGYVLTLI